MRSETTSLARECDLLGVKSGDPRANIQNQKGKAKPYQVKQVLKAIERLEEINGSDE